jgi:hypothetical protein
MGGIQLPPSPKFMTLDAALAVLLLFSAAAYLVLGLCLFRVKRELGTIPIGLLFVVVGLWVLGGAIELLSTDFLVGTGCASALKN